MNKFNSAVIVHLYILYSFILAGTDQTGHVSWSVPAKQEHLDLTPSSFTFSRAQYQSLAEMLSQTQTHKPHLPGPHFLPLVTQNIPLRFIFCSGLFTCGIKQWMVPFMCVCWFSLHFTPMGGASWALPGANHSVHTMKKKRQGGRSRLSEGVSFHLL